MTLFAQLKTLLLGRQLPTSAHAEERLSNAEALAVLSSDALSSVAYATEEILIVLVTVGSFALGYALPIALAIVVLLIIVMLSYRQTIQAYPKGGGSYIVARENLGLYPGLIAAASLMIDYILTVTVSVSAGTAALTAAVPLLEDWTVDLCLLFIFLLMVVNLRGVRESGRIFMIPTYAFIGCILLLIMVGLLRLVQGYSPPAYGDFPAVNSFSLFIILKAFSAGCSAMTGVEAISDGVLAFKPPEWKNARLTLLWMGGILGVMFLGITYLANAYHIVHQEGQTIVSQLGLIIFGDNFIYYFLQLATLFVLLLAANTSFADFPRLCYFLGRDGFLPRQLALLGDRLVYSNGIMVLSLLAALLIIIFQGNVNSVIPLYAVGVFTSFTLSQAGMVRHWFQNPSSGWHARALMNGIGTLATSLVLTVIVITKFQLGAWLVVIAIPLVVVLFLKIHAHYQYVADRLSLEHISPHHYPPQPLPTVMNHPAIVVVGHLNRGTLEALDYARAIADYTLGIHVDFGGTDREKLQRRWQEFAGDVALVILESPYRSVITPIVDYVNDFEQQHKGTLFTVIIPTFVTRTWWENLLHNQTTIFLKAALRANKKRIVTSVRYYL